ncbi:MAG TPA: VanZ family protein, partial [Bryobacteraceae bacterium]|nr:VanZ family protein [Bryobacteraceae bacterium]
SARLSVIAIGIVAVIVYGSLYPFHFFARPLAEGPFWTLLACWRIPADRDDNISNFLLYLPLGLSVTRAARKHWLGAIGAIVLGFALSMSMEMTQFYDPGRVPQMADVYANTAGAIAGAGFALLLPRKPMREPFAMLMVAVWAGYEMFPRFPIDFIGQGVMLIAVAVMLGAVMGRESKPATMLAAALVAALVIFDALRPFQFHASAREFGWMPFAGFIDGPRQNGVRVFFEKAFLYGALTWLAARAGMRLGTAAMLGVALEFGLRYTEIYLPGRSAEITDALMVAMLAGLQGLLREPPSRRAAYPPSAAPAVPR